MAKKRERVIVSETREEAEVLIKEKIEPVEKTLGPKIHFQKYVAKNSISKNLVALMVARDPTEMRTEKEWEELIKKERLRRRT